MVIQTERLLLFLCCFLQQTQFCWHPDLPMQFATFTAKRHQIPKATPKFSGIALGHSLNSVSRQIMQATKPSKSMVSLVLQA